MSWGTAGMRALLIVAYFVLATVWLPSRVIRLGPVAELSSTVQGVVATAVWAGALITGMWALRFAQGRRAI